MLYKFKSEAGGDVIMLEAAGRQVLDILGKGHDAKGILLPDQMPGALTALQAAIGFDEQSGSADDQACEPDDKARQRVSLRTRVWPLVSLIERSLKEQVPVTWGV